MKLPLPRPILALLAAVGVAAMFGLPCHMVGATNFGIVIGTLGGFLAGWIVLDP